MTGWLIERLGIDWPIFQAPMAGVATPALAAAATEAGGLGGLGLGASTVAGARAMIRDTRALTGGPFNVNLFCHAPAQSDAAVEAAWLAAMAPLFHGFGAEPPAGLAEIYQSFLNDDAMLTMLLEERPAVVSFHFGLPDRRRIAALKAAGIVLFASATSVAEARAAEAAGLDAVVAQGYEAGGHRGIFDPTGPDEQLGALELTRQLTAALSCPVIAAGGLMNGADIAAALAAGAEAAQLGTAFVVCPETAADAAYRAALHGAAAAQTRMTAAISGRPARALPNRFTDWAEAHAELSPPAYPIAYDAGKALNAAAKAAGETGFGAQWAGQGAPRARALPAAELMATLIAELKKARGE
ncbi:NAD(P)H-dependent flavin oxidoreductase [Pseudodonghicola flavimaris]|uniref:Propionate 3-nitronate monooxygenase n=1 Tax=Pseudodonghicola flavimaris TaxID=3050036 RepID=A0ABT7EXW9_9RHOB|nr:nitronate monooxygenase [Pseudodonghicola flavimaris]MDK3017179.1 nitronate monooxygenase [Pseudodonghicola flavimaris]